MAPSIIALASVLADGCFCRSLAWARCRDAGGSRGTKWRHLHLDASVSRIRMRDGRVHAAEADGVGVFECRAVISTASPLITLGPMLGGQELPTAWRRRVGRTRFSMKAFSVQLGLANKIDTPSHLNYVLPS
jgi:phytoene dehydrogenase-like protein